MRESTRETRESGSGPADTTSVEARAATTRRALVVDDNVDSAETLGMMLELAGHTTKLAHDGARAIEMAGAFRPDIIFLDIGLPGMDGYEVAERLRADARLEGVRLVAVTGFAEDKSRMKEAGFDLHLTKPLTCSMIENALARVEPR